MWEETAAFALLAIAGASPPVEQPSQSPVEAREDQWLYRETLGDGAQQATATFLSWDYSSVLFGATCDRRTGELVLRTKLETGPDAPPVEPLEISSTSSTVRLRTRISDGHLEGRTRVTEELAGILRSDGDLEVFVPTELGEPLYVGRAEPLRALGLACGN